MTEPVSVGEAKARLGVRTNHRDDEIAGLIPAARLQIEALTGHVLTRRSIAQAVSRFDCAEGLELNYWPVASVDAVTGRDASGVMQPIVGPRLIADVAPARVFPAVGSAWPLGGNPAGLLVTMTAGYATPDEVPEDLKQALLLLVGHWFENHEAVVVGTTAVALPLGVRDICYPYRIPGIV